MTETWGFCRSCEGSLFSACIRRLCSYVVEHLQNECIIMMWVRTPALVLSDSSDFRPYFLFRFPMDPQHKSLYGHLVGMAKEACVVLCCLIMCPSSNCRYPFSSSQDHSIRYCALDFSVLSKHRHMNVLKELEEVAAWTVGQVGFFCR